MVYAGSAPVTFAVESLHFPEDHASGDGRAPVPHLYRLGSRSGVGFDQAGHWPPGTYKVSCQNEGREFAAGSFEVFDGSAPATPTSGSSLRLFGKKANAAGPPAYGQAFEIGAFDTLYAEASVPSRSAGDSTAFRCAVTDPAGVTSGSRSSEGVATRVDRPSDGFPRWRLQDPRPLPVEWPRRRPRARRRSLEMTGAPSSRRSMPVLVRPRSMTGGLATRL